MFSELCVNGQESEYPFSFNAYESEYSKIDECGIIYESGTISSSANLVSILWAKRLEGLCFANYKNKYFSKRSEKYSLHHLDHLGNERSKAVMQVSVCLSRN